MSLEAPTKAGANPFSVQVIGIVLAIAIMSFAAVVTLSAWSPEISDPDLPGAQPYSSSADGYAAFRELLDASGYRTSVSRVAGGNGGSLRVLAPPTIASQDAIDLVDVGGPTLVILPKWSGEPDPNRPNWHGDLQMISRSAAARVAKRFYTGSTISRSADNATFITEGGRFDPVFEGQMQLISGEQLIPVLGDDDGALLVQLEFTETYILADPDVMNTIGLANFENARLGLSIMDQIVDDRDGTIVFDATLNGFTRSNSLLRLMLDIPFIGATLAALIALGLLGWASSVRFGSPLKEERAHALGKAALTDSTAGLIAMARREGRTASGYLTLTRRAIVKQLGLSRTATDAELSALLDRMSETRKSTHRWSDLATALSTSANGREDLLDKAQRLYRWREETLDERH